MHDRNSIYFGLTVYLSHNLADGAETRPYTTKAFTSLFKSLRTKFDVLNVVVSFRRRRVCNHVLISSFGLLVLSGVATANEAGELEAGGSSGIVQRGTGQSGSRAGHFSL